jgi:hypothetical protein
MAAILPAQGTPPATGAAPLGRDIAVPPWQHPDRLVANVANGMDHRLGAAWGPGKGYGLIGAGVFRRRVSGRPSMSSVQYSLCSTAGLETVTDTPDHAAAVLVRHLAQAACRGAVNWMISGPEGRIHHGRFEPRPGELVSVAVADHVDAVHGLLLRDAARLMTA